MTTKQSWLTVLRCFFVSAWVGWTAIAHSWLHLWEVDAINGFTVLCGIALLCLADRRYRIENELAAYNVWKKNIDALYAEITNYDD